ncbi:MAG: Hpt domain-containing protein [Dechloromonas sp.]|nr:Hpt domain-containing protein [Dechloromonas sp.]
MVSDSGSFLPPSDTGDWPGLDVAGGLDQVFNKPALYRKLLRSYCGSNEATAQKLDAALAAGDRNQLSRLAHTLKGTSGTLGMPAVYAAASALERADPAASPAQLAALLNELKIAQETVRMSIERYLASD